MKQVTVAEGQAAPNAKAFARTLVVSVLAGLFMKHKRSLTTFGELDLLAPARDHVWAQSQNPELRQEINGALGAALLDVARSGYLSVEAPPDRSGLRQFSLTEAALRAFDAAASAENWHLPDFLAPVTEPGSKGGAEQDPGADDPPPPSRLRDLPLLERSGTDPNVISEKGVLYLIGPLPQQRGKGWWALAGLSCQGVRARHAVFAVGKLAEVFDELRAEGVVSTDRLERETGARAIKNHLSQFNKCLIALELSPLRFQAKAGGYPTTAHAGLRRITPTVDF